MNEPIKFFLPGPTYVPEDARQAMTKPMVGHRSAGFKDFYLKIAERLPKVLRTSGRRHGRHRQLDADHGERRHLLRSAGDVLNITNGAFSERWHSMSKSVGRAADKLAFPWGQADRSGRGASRPCGARSMRP